MKTFFSSVAIVVLLLVSGCNSKSVGDGKLTYKVIGHEGHVDVGSLSTTITVVEITNDNTEDAFLKGVTFKMLGSAITSDVRIAELRDTTGMQLASSLLASWREGNLLTFEFGPNPIFIPRGGSQLLELHIQFAAGICRSIAFDVENIKAMGVDSGLSMQTEENPVSTAPTPQLIQYVVKFELDLDNPATGDVPAGTDNHVLMVFTVNSTVSALADSLEFKIIGSSDGFESNFSDVKLWSLDEAQEWQVVGGPSDLLDPCTDSECSVTLTDSFMFPVCSQQTFRITADVGASAAGSAVRVELDPHEIVTFYDDGDPYPYQHLWGGVLVGNDQTIVSP